MTTFTTISVRIYMSMQRLYQHVPFSNVFIAMFVTAITTVSYLNLVKR